MRDQQKNIKMATGGVLSCSTGNMSAISSDLYPDWLHSEIKTGTTIMAVEYDGGVVIGADSRTTRGSYIANRVTDKLTFITDRIFCCRSGSAADTQAIADGVRYELDLLSAETQKRPLVKVAANIFRNTCYEKRDSASAGIIVAGWDERHGGQVYCVPIGGMCVRQPFTIGGSGSAYIYGFCDSKFKRGMTKEECMEFVSSAVSLAIFRDGSSGGCIRLAAIDKDGVDRKVLLGNELPTFFQG
ncbi:proteasome subunit beta type-6-like [Hydractinia symbiolongicarpus]|uniref:proteasome subunit beta type-6-like n=1 Tax=Hydractinia symbiolongicarpus TaxID=13093 RepID=UPI00254FC064|nr:proteasome subunit beta type-6-like [Hydractinia symbiolongicarpus]